MHFLCFPHSKYFLFVFLAVSKQSRLLVFIPTTFLLVKKMELDLVFFRLWFLVKSSKRLPKYHVLACCVGSDSSARFFFRKPTGPRTRGGSRISFFFRSAKLIFGALPKHYKDPNLTQFSTPQTNF